MTGPGYPDFARLTQSGGSELASVSGTIASGTAIYSGPCAAWPYINLACEAGTGSVNYWLSFTYYADAALATQVAVQDIARSTSTYGVCQVPVMGPYVIVFIQSAGSVDITGSLITVYGSYGRASSRELDSTSIPIYDSSSNIPASGTTQEYPGRILPGSATLSIFTDCANWNFYIRYWNWVSNTYNTYWRTDYTVAAHGGVFPCPMLNSPAQLNIYNGTTSAAQFVIGWVPGGH